MSDTLIVGATGRVGGLVAGELDRRGVGYAVMSSRPAAARERFGDVREGDMRRPETLPAALEGVRRAFLVTPLGPDETDCGHAFLDAADAAGVQKIVYVAIMNIEAMAAIPHFATKLPIRERLLASGPNVVIDANFFMQNDLLAEPALRAGVYPLPIGRTGVNSVDARDVALASANALVGDAHDGRAVPVCGPDVVTGPSAAEAYGRATGRLFAYPGDAIDPFIGAIAAAMPMDDWVEHDLREMMRVTQELGCLATEDDHARCRAVLGQAPRRHADFVAEVASRL